MNKLAAILIETRPTPDFTEIVKGHMDNLPYPHHTPLTFYGKEAFNHTDSFRFKYKSRCYLDIQIDSIDKYNLLLTDPLFWNDYLEFERVLIFQTDSMLLRPGIEEFYPYDYVGAPWPWQQHGGNGGLSLRNPRLMKEICEKYPFVPGADGNEDVYFCNHMHNKAIGNLAPRAVCEKFSVESIFSLGTLGYHAIGKYLSVEEIDKIITQYNGRTY